MKIMRFMLGVMASIVFAYLSENFLQNYPSEFWTSTLIFPITVVSVTSWLSQWLPEGTAIHFARFSLGTAQVSA